MTRMRAGRLGTLIAFWLTTLGTSTATAATITVTVQNLSTTDGVFLTPVWVGFHNGGFDLYDIGVPASAELERMAEDGNAAPLSSAFLASGSGVTDGVVVGAGGPIAPGETTVMSFDLDAGLTTSRYFSYAAMIIPSNDAFIANGNPVAHEIFDASGNFLGADFIVLGSAVLDAGTEVNDEIPVNTAFLGQTVPDTGTDENGVVQLHPGFIPGGNILTMFPSADFTAGGYQVARISVTATPAVPEPSTLLLLGTGLAAVAHRRRRSRR
jgi:hypothetical protein